MKQLLVLLEIFDQYTFTDKQLPHDWLTVHITIDIGDGAAGGQLSPLDLRIC